ncbi:MAG TPA: arginine--tRNA ligase [Gemmatimonadota bacterium]|nr:arginine--tRNA ligase [Gemmatimonadota bacterium]
MTGPEGMDQLAGETALRDEIGRVARAVGAPEDFVAELERPANPEHGDLSSNAALVLAKPLRMAPRQIAEQIAGQLDRERAGVTSVEIAGPGFLNFRLDDGLVWDGLRELLGAGEAWGRSEPGDAADQRSRQRINVEFVSANPTGPLHVAHGRGAAIGDVVAELLAWTGHDVSREYYVNDAGGQIDRLGESVEARFQQARGETGPVAEIPEGGYQGSYVADVAVRIVEAEGEDALLAMDRDARCELFAERASALLRQEQADDLADFGIRMDHWFEESSLLASGAIDELLERLDGDAHAYRDEGALWLRTTEFGDEKDRVLVKSDGSLTYFVSDIAYHIDKRARGFDHAIDVWGADHHGHVARMQASLEAVGLGPGFLECIIIQLVKVLRDGEEVRMSKRAGQFVTLRELFDETGSDVARYFFLMRRAEVPMNFDLDLALDTSDANPVFKVQYAHARMCSIFEKAGEDMDAVAAAAAAGEIELSRLELDAEREVAKALLRLPERIAAAAEGRTPHLICTYLEEVAGLVNAWYHEGNLDPSRRVLAEGEARPARLALTAAIRSTLRQGLAVLGLSAPVRMVREDEVAGAAAGADVGAEPAGAADA